MTAVWASHHEALCSDGVVAPHGFAPLIGSDLGVVLDRRDPPGATVDAGLEAATLARRAEHTAEAVSLNFSLFVARQIWQKRGLSPRRFRAHRLQRGAFYQGLLVYMHPNVDLLQTARN